MDFSWIEKARNDEQIVFSGIEGVESTVTEAKPNLRDEILGAAILNIKPKKIGASDPGKQRDSYGFVGVEYNPPNILVKAAKRFSKSYLKVEQSIADIHHDLKYDYQVVEINNVGLHVWEVLKYVKRLPIIAVNTSKNLTVDPTKPFDPFKFPSMDKNDMARWLYLQNEMGNIIFPKNPSKEMIELKNQFSNIVEYKTEGTGTVSYRAEGQEHDDLWMALLLDCWFIRENLMKPQNADPLIGVGGNYYKEEIEPNDRIIDEIKKRMQKDFHLEDVKIDYT